MLYCEKCKVYLTGSMCRCPLCHGGVSGKPGEDSYPTLPGEREPYWLTVRLAALISVTALVICAVVNFFFHESGWWSLFVAAGLASMWLLIAVAVWKRNNPMRTIVWQLALVSGLVLVWDWCTGSAGWSINFVLPIFIPCIQLTTAVVVRILHLHPSDYLIYLGACILAGFGPLIPLLNGTLWTIFPSVICAGISAVSLCALVLYKGSALKAEFVRRMHL